MFKTRIPVEDGMASSQRVAVVGGGAAGLTAAYHLQRAGATPVVLEARPAVGGRIRTDSVDGYQIDTYTQLFGSMHTEILRLLEDLDADHLAVKMPGRDALWRNGRAHEVVYGSITSMLATGAVPITTKLRLGTRYLRFLDTMGGDLDLHAPERAAIAGLDGESVAAWGRRELDEDFVEYLAYPLLASYCGVAPEEVSAGLYHVLAHAGTNVSMFALRGGIGRMAELLGRRISHDGGEVRTSCQVRRVVHDGREVVVSGDGWTERFAGAVLCVPGVEVPILMPDLPLNARAWFAAVRYQPLASLALLLDEPLGVRYFALSFTRRDSQTISSVCVQENKGADLVPDGKGLLVLFPAPQAVRLFIDSEPEQVLAAVLPDLSRIFPSLRGRIRRAKLYRWPVGGPVVYPGYLAHLQAFRGGSIEGDVPITFGGSYLASPSAEGSVQTGRLAAERLLARLGGEPRRSDG
jgi:protoporphyrinogen/coproporphyrinogen III oxidase